MLLLLQCQTSETLSRMAFRRLGEWAQPTPKPHLVDVSVYEFRTWNPPRPNLGSMTLYVPGHPANDDIATIHQLCESHHP